MSRGSRDEKLAPPCACRVPAIPVELSVHARARLRQRGLREADVALVLAHGEPAQRDAVVLTARAVEAAMREHRRAIAGHRRALTHLERLCGTAVFVRDGVVVSSFRPTPVQLRRLRRVDPASARRRQAARARSRATRGARDGAPHPEPGRATPPPAPADGGVLASMSSEPEAWR